MGITIFLLISVANETMAFVLVAAVVHFLSSLHSIWFTHRPSTQTPEKKAKRLFFRTERQNQDTSWQ